MTYQGPLSACGSESISLSTQQPSGCSCVSVSMYAGRYVPRAVLMDLVSSAPQPLHHGSELLCLKLKVLCRANACSREAGCPCRSPVLWTQCVPAHSVRSSGPTTSSSARYTQRLPPFWPSDQLLLRGQMCAPKHTQAASLTKMYFADRRRQQLGQGPLHRGCRVDRLGLGCRAEGGGELRLPTRYAHTTASGPTLTQL